MGRRFPQQLHDDYKHLAQLLRLPVSLVTQNALQQWWDENAEAILKDRSKQIKFAESLVQKYLPEIAA